MSKESYGCCGANGSILEELAFHFPYAVYSVAMTIGILSFFTLGGNGNIGSAGPNFHDLFHSFHFMHIAFATTGTLITYLRFSRNMLGAFIVGLIVPSIFCLLSDVIMPYYGAKLFGVNMHLHICFISELHNILPFLFMGMINGFVLSRHGVEHQGLYSVISHFSHILVSSFASGFYLISHGFDSWHTNIGSFFLFLIGAVVVPCTLGDVVVPMFFARVKRNNEEHTA